MKRPLQLAYGCHGAAALVLGSFGLVYLLRSEFMPYHAVAVGQSWSEVPAAYQVLIVALMRVVGGAWLATATALIMVLVGPFRRGQPWARWAVGLVGLLAYGSALYATLLVQHHTPATPPVGAALAGILCAGAGLVLSQWGDGPP